MRLNIIRALITALLTVGSYSSASAQSTNASLSGLIEDAQGAARYFFAEAELWRLQL
jgi:hypothetical protein